LIGVMTQAGIVVNGDGPQGPHTSMAHWPASPIDPLRA
jgi:hypothetical protein